MSLCLHLCDRNAVELSEANDFAISKVSGLDKFKSLRLHLETH